MLQYPQPISDLTSNKSKGKVRVAVTELPVLHFSISQLHGGGAYLPSVAVLSSTPSEKGRYQFVFLEDERLNEHGH